MIALTNKFIFVSIKVYSKITRIRGSLFIKRVEADGNEKLNFDVSFPSKQGATTIVEDDTNTKASWSYIEKAVERLIK